MSKCVTAVHRTQGGKVKGKSEGLGIFYHEIGERGKNPRLWIPIRGGTRGDFPSVEKIDTPMRLVTGGIRPYDLTLTTSPLIIEYSKQALLVYNDNNNTNFEYDCLVKADCRLVAGFMYYITFEALSGNIRATFHARVWEKVGNQGSHVQSCEKLE
ncbi:hypothetical protein PIB30_026397 [Stylosanthes scabra]|uniref:Cystatin domain-containing protein n=1 Tax=Stylosanthes scabra TaxID=79078 RepID=A0ABU6SAT2_9FABA|nr:hypothetical protein [Stylosanthes scabra]